MKFGTKLKRFVIPEWSDKYIRYKELSRLAKRASRLKTGKIKGVEDEDEKELLENLFTVDCGTLPHSNAVRTSYCRSSTSSKTEERDFKRASSASALGNTGVYSIGFPNDSSQISVILEEHSEGSSESASGSVSPKEENNDRTMELVSAAAEQYTSTGYICSESLKNIQENAPYLDSLLRDLEEAEEEAERRREPTRSVYDPKKGSNANNRMRDTNSSLLSSPLKSQLLHTNTSGDRVATEKLDGASYTPSTEYNMHGKRRWCDFIRFHRKGRHAQNGGVRFNLSKHTPNMQDEALSMFHKILRDDIRTVIVHYVTEMEYIKSLVRFLKNDIARRGKLDDSYANLIRRACTAFWDSCDKLRLYLNLNTLAVFKALKKKDKLLGTSDVFNLYPTYKNILLSLDTSSNTVEEVAQIYNSLMDHMFVDFGVLKRNMEETLDGMRKKPAHGLFFIYGLCTVLFANSVFLCSFNFNYTFNLNLLLSQMPNFRLFFIFSLVWLGFGWCQNYLETYGVNYQFQFGLSSNYAASENDYYLVGVFQMLTCLTLFVAFVLDCRLHVIPSHNFYCLYSILLVVISLVVIMWPNENLKLKFRKRLFMAILRVLGAPFGVGEKVTLADSIIADVMTSLTRSLHDLVWMITYFSVGMFSDKTVEAPIVKNWIVPIVMCYPYFIRFSQCFRRYLSERRWLHVGNMAKYVSGISCVVVSSIDWVALFNIEVWQRRFIVICFYIVATLFQCWWDFVIDWGLDISWNMFKTRNNRCMYRRKAYYSAVFFNMACRCTWALTTMPFTLIEHKELSSFILFVIVSVIEIVRRIVWVTFRLESEHLLNSYKYRTALWVPKLYNCKNLIVKEMKMLNEKL